MLPVRTPVKGVIADYNAELRREDGRVDVPLMVRQLKALGVNTYFWLIWHAKTDWDDLKLFLPEARRAGLDVWVYLVPPSESPPHTSLYSEPFRLDYIRWAREIALLSRAHRNLKAWVIDDFYYNRRFFSPKYVSEMQKAAKSVNPGLAFLPLMYYDQIGFDFVLSYKDCIDGVVAAYPRDEGEISRARKALSDRLSLPARCAISFPPETRSKPGQFARITQKAQVTSARCKVGFRQRDDYIGPTEGYHFKQFLVDGRVVWEEDVARGRTDWEEVECDISRLVKGKREVALSFGVLDRKGVANFGVTVEFADLRVEGLEVEADFRSSKGWLTEKSGPWEVEFLPGYEGRGRFRIPLVVMTAASPSAFKKVWGVEGTPERIAKKFEMALESMRRGLCDGAVTYCLPKRPGDPVFGAVREVILKFRHMGQNRG